MKKYPFCSVIIPAYNTEKTISLLLESLVKQDYQGEYEVIVVDNRSTDATVGEVEKFSHVRILHERDIQSSYAARNRGIKNAEGEVLAFIDADCIASENWFKKGIGEMTQRKADLVAGEVVFTFENKQPSVYEYLDSVRKLKQETYVQKGFGATANLFVRKQVFKKIGFFRQDLQSGGDYEFGKRATKNGLRLHYSNKAYVFHPARSTFGELIKKTKRVARGLAQLQKMNLLEENKLSFLSFLPILSVPQNRDYKHFSIWNKTLMLTIANYIKYTSLSYRLYYLITL